MTENLSKLTGLTLTGISPTPITIEVDTAKGIPSETIVGLADTVVKESKTRIKSALKHSGFDFPPLQYTINLSPAEIKKQGPLLDLPIAIAILRATSQIPETPNTIFIGELGLDGRILPVRGILALCHKDPIPNCIFYIPTPNFQETTLLNKPNIHPITHLKDIKQITEGTYTHKYKPTPPPKPSTIPQYDFADIKGQALAKRALSIAATGRHNILLIGPPGSGKSMLIKRLPTILPPLTIEEAIDTLKIQSITGNLNPNTMLIPPFRSPHHSVSYAGMVGGGSNPQPGEISLAHNGILFLDELPEFGRKVLEVLRQPLEDKTVSISRAMVRVDYPADFLFAAAMNPCPCGYHGDTKKRCICPKALIEKYWEKLSGPILDRVDLIIEVPRVDKNDLLNTQKKELESPIHQKIIKSARDFQAKRYKKNKLNNSLSPSELDHYCPLERTAKVLLEKALDSGHLTARSLHRTIKVARSIADLEQNQEIKTSHISEALQYRRC